MTYVKLFVLKKIVFMFINEVFNYLFKLGINQCKRIVICKLKMMLKCTVEGVEGVLPVEIVESGDRRRDGCNATCVVCNNF